MKDNGQGYFLAKGSILNKVIVKAREAIEVGRKLPFFKYLSIVFFFGKTNFFEKILSFLIFDIYLYLGIFINICMSFWAWYLLLTQPLGRFSLLVAVSVYVCVSVCPPPPLKKNK